MKRANLTKSHSHFIEIVRDDINNVAWQLGVLRQLNHASDGF